jgi:rhamnulokinase
VRDRSFLAFDLGAESGRAILGRLRAGVLETTEVHRFQNDPVFGAGALRWNVRALWAGIQRGLEIASGTRLDGVAVDAWGVDYALIDSDGALLEDPYHYRDARTAGEMERLFTIVPRDRLYATTGIQCLPINTLYQLHAACRETPDVIARARTLLTIPDFFNNRLTGRACTEYTIASTTQCIDATMRTWATGLIEEAGLPARLFAPIVGAGTVIGSIEASASAAFAGTPVVATACHDTAAAVAAIRTGDGAAFLSSGTWSLLGTELPAPILSVEARDRNFTNEGGVCGTIRLLKNVCGLWLLQSCRRSWAAAGSAPSYDALLAAAADERHAFRSLIDPDDQQFVNPDDMPASIDAYCRRTGQPLPDGYGGYTRAILESLACKYRVVLESLEAVTGRRVDEIRIVGGGSRSRLLNQFTADATGRRVIAGPAEATALGNIAMQMLATGAVGSLGEARAVIDRSFPVERFDPVAHDQWDAQSRRFNDYVGASRCSRPASNRL